MGPGATLAEAFPVPLPRPRDRRTLIDQPDYQKLKAEITSYLVGLNRQVREIRISPTLQMPDVAPKQFRLPSKMPGMKRSRIA